MNGEIFIVVVCALAVAAFARWRGWPAPLLVTAVALAASFLPFAPRLDLDGHLLLAIVLPPLLYSASLDASFVSFRRSLPQISGLGVGLVLVTTGAVGLTAWWLMPSLTLPGALLLGAIIAPPDAVSAAAIGRRLGLPRRVMNVLSGESLINDATSLTLFRVLAAILAGATLSVWDGIGQFLLAVVLGVGLGLAFGIAMHQLRMRVDDSVLVGTFGLLVPFGAYAIAEHIGGSGVLAVVAMGLFIGYNSPRTSYLTRQQERPVWLSLDLLLESFVFAYIGLHGSVLVAGLASSEVAQLLTLSGVVLLVTLLVRPAFVYPSYAWGRMWSRAGQRRAAASGRSGRRGGAPEPALSWRDNAVISWAGMRGVVTLATAIAAADLAGLDRHAEVVILFVAFVVTVATLLLQGLTLPLLIRVLGVADGSDEAEEARARAHVRAESAAAGAAFLAAQREEWAVRFGEEHLSFFDRTAAHFSTTMRAANEESRQADAPGADASAAPVYADYLALSKGWLAVRREVLIRERDAGTLDEEVMRELLEALDAEELALDARSAERPDGSPSRE